MWVIAGVLLGLVVLVGLVGFHTGPHAHVAAGAIGLLAALWFVVMAVDGKSAPLLWALLSADVVISGGMGLLAWKGLSSGIHSERRPSGPGGAEGIALGPLTPDGIVRVRGEDWSAVSQNGDVPAGGRVHVIRAAGVRLEVWREDEVVAGPGLFVLNPGDSDAEGALNGSSSLAPEPSPHRPSPPATHTESKESGS